MPRRKVSMELITNPRLRAATFAKRKEGLKKKARELSTLCDVEVALVCVAAGGEGAAAADVWESDEGVLAKYRALPAAERARHTHRAYAETELVKAVAKLARVRQGGPAALKPWNAKLDDVTPEELQRVLGTVDAALRAADDRWRALSVPVGGGGRLLDGRAAPPGVDGNFAWGVDGDAHAPGNGGEQAMWGDSSFHFQPCRTGGAAVMQPAGYGFHQCTGDGGADMDDLQLQMAPDTYAADRLAWDAFPPRDAGTAQPGYGGFQCSGGTYGGMPDYQTQPNLAMWSCSEQSDAMVPTGYPSLELGHGYMDSSVARAGQGIGGGSVAMGAGGNFINAPSSLSLTMGTGNNFDNAATARPLAMSYGGNLMNANGYTTQWPAPQLQHAGTSSQQSSLQQLHYHSDLEDTQLQLWGN